MTLELVPNPDLLKSLKRPRGLKVVGFALESEKGLAAAKKKLLEKKCDLLVLNSPAALGADTNEITILDSDGGVDRLPVLAKRAAAERIAARLAALFPAQKARAGKAARRSPRAR